MSFHQAVQPAFQPRLDYDSFLMIGYSNTVNALRFPLIEPFPSGGGPVGMGLIRLNPESFVLHVQILFAMTLSRLYLKDEDFAKELAELPDPIKTFQDALKLFSALTELFDRQNLFPEEADAVSLLK